MVLSTGEIARQLGIDRDRVSYLIQKNNIEPVGKVGPARAFSEETVEVVKGLLEGRGKVTV